MRVLLIIVLSIIVAIAVGACESDEEEPAAEHEMTEEESSDEHEEAEDEHEGMEGMSDMSSSSMEGAEHVAVVLTDVGEMYTMAPEVESVHAGPVTYVASNEGLIEHELIVVKLLDMNVDLTSLHVVEGQLVETTEGETVYLADASGNHYGQVIASTGHGLHLDAGSTVELNANMEAGHYMLLCNIATHYQLGMWTEFEAS